MKTAILIENDSGHDNL